MCAPESNLFSSRSFTSLSTDWSQVISFPSECIPGGRRNHNFDKNGHFYQFVHPGRDGGGLVPQFSGWLCGACGMPLRSRSRTALQSYICFVIVTGSGLESPRLFINAYCDENAEIKLKEEEK